MTLYVVCVASWLIQYGSVFLVSCLLELHKKELGSYESVTNSMGRYLNHVFLDTSALMAAEYGEQLLIRDKEETWKRISFRVKIVI